MSEAEHSKRASLPLFSTGQVVATVRAARELYRAGVDPMDLLARHVFGDDGQLDDEDRAANRQSIVNGGRVFSSYEVQSGPTVTKVWIITDAVDDAGRRRSTCILTPGCY